MSSREKYKEYLQNNVRHIINPMVCDLLKNKPSDTVKTI